MAPLAELDRKFDPQETAKDVFENVSGTYPNQITLEESREVILDLAEGARITTFIGPLAHKVLGDKARAKRNTQPTEPNVTTLNRG